MQSSMNCFWVFVPSFSIFYHRLGCSFQHILSYLHKEMSCGSNLAYPFLQFHYVYHTAPHHLHCLASASLQGFHLVDGFAWLISEQQNIPYFHYCFASAFLPVLA